MSRESVAASHEKQLTELAISVCAHFKTKCEGHPQHTGNQSMSLSPHVLDPEQEAIMRRQKRALGGVSRFSSQLSDTTLKSNALYYHDVPSFITSPNKPKKLNGFVGVENSRNDKIKEKVKRHFNKVSKSQERQLRHFREIAERQAPSSGSIAKTSTRDISNISVEPILKKVHLTSLYKVEGISIYDPYGDSGKYTGQFLAGKPHGVGVMNYANGTSYEGEWKEGKWHGKGIARFACGDTYEGIFEMDRRSGFGLYKWKDGRSYEGEFHVDKRHGLGVYKWSKGAKYHGVFFQGHRHGEGVYTFADGSVYIGGWKKGKFHGSGEVNWKDGRSRKGEWRDGRAVQRQYYHDRPVR